jgi:hypothetical protein
VFERGNRSTVRYEWGDCSKENNQVDKGFSKREVLQSLESALSVPVTFVGLCKCETNKEDTSELDDPLVLPFN